MPLCDSGRINKGVYVCGNHGFMWPDSEMYCNAIPRDVREALEAAWDSGYWQGIEHAQRSIRDAPINTPLTNPFKED